MAEQCDWSKLTDKQRKEIANDGYSDYSSGAPVTVNDNRTIVGWAVGGTTDPGHNGGQVTIVANNPDPNKATNIAVLYRGSSSPLKLTDDHFASDLKQDWIDNDLPEGLNILGSKQSASSVPQLASASKTLKDVIRKYPNAKIDVYGHSLGSMAGQYALADLTPEEAARINGGYLYEGPNVYNSLNDRQKHMADSYAGTGKVFNYIDYLDIIGDVGNFGDYKMVGDRVYVDPSSSSKFWMGSTGLIVRFLYSVAHEHGWGGYQFKDGKFVKTDQVSLARTWQMVDHNMEHFGDIRKALQSSGGGLSDGEKIWLDCDEAGIFVQGMLALIAQGDVQFKDWLDESCSKADEEWKGTLADASGVGGSLSGQEVLDALAQGGATETVICEQPKGRYHESFTKFTAVGEDFTDLAGRIQNAAKSVVSTDQDLAGQLAAMA
ncbi:hypothetical protein OZX72_07505 [Bifidobacterium sp. ESL0769]|uniref:Mbeg1-like protein n=1 Tax=Bifidobacterium sp. ESL0769 TaxID=2983229 RepID=UPI0023F8E3D0|nr:hypothetical protein [Bifidobacterium sp. ESL0769]WEV67082.1 hypothetical protein OZX72_07505 [Bifidobacterium sp. ESL0769]